MAGRDLTKTLAELQRLQKLLKDARKLVVKELGSAVLDAYMQGKTAEEIYEVTRHIVDDVYRYREYVDMRRSLYSKSSKGKVDERKEDGGMEVSAEGEADAGLV